jgi:hypothetical protein
MCRESSPVAYVFAEPLPLVLQKRAILVVKTPQSASVAPADVADIAAAR